MDIVYFIFPIKQNITNDVQSKNDIIIFLEHIKKEEEKKERNT